MIRNLFTITLLFMVSLTFAQLPVSGFYAKQNELTIAPGYSFKSYDKFYMGGELGERNPANLGEIKASIISFYAEYGISNWLSTTVTLPYVSVKSDAGNPDPVLMESDISGIQDLSVSFKAKVLEKNFKDSSKITVGAATGISFPVGNYEGIGILAIGNQATAIDINSILQYTTPFNMFAEFQSGYSIRNRKAFDLPNVTINSFKLGYYNEWIYAHSKVLLYNSIDGLDIGTPEFGAAGGATVLSETEEDYTQLAFDVYVPVYKQMLGLSAGYYSTLNGRNTGDVSGFSFGLVYSIR